MRRASGRRPVRSPKPRKRGSTPRGPATKAQRLARVELLCAHLAWFMVRAAPAVDDDSDEVGIVVFYRNGGGTRACSYAIGDQLYADPKTVHQFVFCAAAQAIGASA